MWVTSEVHRPSSAQRELLSTNTPPQPHPPRNTVLKASRTGGDWSEPQRCTHAGLLIWPPSFLSSHTYSSGGPNWLMPLFLPTHTLRSQAWSLCPRRSTSQRAPPPSASISTVSVSLSEVPGNHSGAQCSGQPCHHTLSVSTQEIHCPVPNSSASACWF